MGIQKPSIPKGTRDFSPAEMMRRQYIFDTVKGVFRTYGFAPLETPSMENLSTLLGKYGEEGDKLLFKILNSGDYAAGLSDDEVRQASRICEKGLRYDLTVPFARYVVQHQGELTFPFKRYQVQPVWRADRPQKGRYREFYQCDVDVIGTRSLLCEVELIEIVERVFRALGIRVALKMNNRKILFGIAEAIGHADKMMDITVAIDKLEKIGLDNVKAELLERGLGQEAGDKLQPILELSGDNSQKLTKLREVLAVSETGLKGIEEMETVFGYVHRPDGGAGSFAGARTELLHRGDLRSQGARFRHRFYLRRRPLRRPDRHFRHAQHVGRGHFVRRGPHIRRDDGAEPFPRRGQLHDAGVLHQPRRRGGGRVAGAAPLAARCGRRRRNLP